MCCLRDGGNLILLEPNDEQAGASQLRPSARGLQEHIATAADVDCFVLTAQPGRTLALELEAGGKARATTSKPLASAHRRSDFHLGHRSHQSACRWARPVHD